MTKEEFFKPDHRRMIEKVKMPISAADFNYESPIAIDKIVENIVEESSKEIDKLTYKAIMQVGVRVDKEELIRALAYDRDQYSKGFKDGLASSEKKTEVYCTEGMCKFLKGGICTKDEIHLIHDECRSFEVEDQERQQT